MGRGDRLGAVVTGIDRLSPSMINKRAMAGDKLSTAFWFTIGSGLLAGWLGLIFAVSEGSGVMAGAVALAAGGVTFGLLGISIAKVLSHNA